MRGSEKVDKDDIYIHIYIYIYILSGLFSNILRSNNNNTRIPTLKV